MTRYKVCSMYVYGTNNKYIGHLGEGEFAGVFRGGSSFRNQLITNKHVLE